MKTNGFFEKHSPKLFREAVLRSALCGMAVGFSANFIAAVATWFAPVNGLWICIGVFVAVSIIASFLFYFMRFRPSDVSSARRLDSYGLDERLVTMVEYRNENSYIANLQREDAKHRLSLIDTKLIKIIIPRAIAIALSVCGTLGIAMTTVNALSDSDIIPSGNELLGDITNDATTEYVSVSYVIDEGGVIEGDEEQVILKGSDASTVTAVADDGYVFKEWSDGYASPTRTDKAVGEDVTYEAIFTELDDGGDGDGDGDGDGEDGDEPKDAPSESEGDNGDGNNDSDGNPNNDSLSGGGSITDQSNLIINNDQAHRDVIDRMNEETSDHLENNGGSLSQEEIDMIKAYLGIV